MRAASFADARLRVPQVQMDHYANGGRRTKRADKAHVHVHRTLQEPITGIPSSTPPTLLILSSSAEADQAPASRVCMLSSGSAGPIIRLLTKGRRSVSRFTLICALIGATEVEAPWQFWIPWSRRCRPWTPWSVRGAVSCPEVPVNRVNHKVLLNEAEPRRPVRHSRDYRLTFGGGRDALRGHRAAPTIDGTVPSRHQSPHLWWCR